MEVSALINSLKFKTVLFALLLAIFPEKIFAQAPQAFNYQAQARDNADKIIVNKPVSIKASILSNSATGLLEYSETHNALTDSQGIFTLELGKGKAESGTFSEITWGAGTKWLKIEMDALGGSNFSLVGSSQLLSVPYALYSGKSGTSTLDPAVQMDEGIVDFEKSTTFNNTNIKASTIGTGNCTISKIIYDSDTNLYVLGYLTYDNFTIGSNVLNNSKSPGFIAKISKDGILQWVKTISTVYGSLLYVNGLIVISQGFVGDVFYDGKTFAASGASNKDNFLMALNTKDGSLAWSQRFSNTGEGYTLINNLESDGLNLYVTGSFTRSGFQVGSTSFATAGSYLAQINIITGNPNWATGFSSTSLFLSNIFLNKGSIYIVGNFSGDLKAGSYTVPSSGSGFVVESNNLGSIVASPILFPFNNNSGGGIISTLLNKMLFVTSSNLGTSSSLTRINLTTREISPAVPIDITYEMIPDTVHNFIYNAKLRKYSVDGNSISIKGADKPSYYFTGLKNGIAYYAGNIFMLDKTVYNTMSSYTIIKYDMNTESILEKVNIRSMLCSYSVPIIIGNKRFILATNGLIKANGVVHSGLIFVSF